MLLQKILSSAIGNILAETTTEFCTQNRISATTNRIMQLVPVAVPYHNKASGLKLEHLRHP